MYMADSPDQRQLKTQKWTHVACESKRIIPYQSNKHGGYMKKTYVCSNRRVYFLQFSAPQPFPYILSGNLP